MASLSSQKSAPVLVILLAGLVGYIAYTGAVIDNLGMSGLTARQQKVVAVRDTIARLEAGTDSAKKELAHGTVEDLRKRLETYRGSLALLRRLRVEPRNVLFSNPVKVWEHVRAAHAVGVYRFAADSVHDVVGEVSGRLGIRPLDPQIVKFVIHECGSDTWRRRQRSFSRALAIRDFTVPTPTPSIRPTSS